MAPLVIIAVPCENIPCDVNNTIVQIVNDLRNRTDGSQDDYDHEGAARFIIATVLVYSLMGVFGMMLLRIKRSASRSRRSNSTREETVLKFIKKTDRLMLEARRDVLKREAERTSNRLKFLRMKSQESNTSLNPSDFSPSSSLNLSASFNNTSRSPTVLMPLLPAVPETPAEGAGNPPNNIPNAFFRFTSLALSPLTIPQTVLTVSQPNSSTASCSSTPVALVTGFNQLPGFILQTTSSATGQDDEPLGLRTQIDCNMNDTNCKTSSCSNSMENDNINVTGKDIGKNSDEV